jgi:hypothetical protein
VARFLWISTYRKDDEIFMEINIEKEEDIAKV